MRAIGWWQWLAIVAAHVGLCALSAQPVAQVGVLLGTGAVCYPLAPGAALCTSWLVAATRSVVYGGSDGLLADDSDTAHAIEAWATIGATIVAVVLALYAWLAELALQRRKWHAQRTAAAMADVGAALLANSNAVDVATGCALVPHGPVVPRLGAVAASGGIVVIFAVLVALPLQTTALLAPDVPLAVSGARLAALLVLALITVELLAPLPAAHALAFYTLALCAQVVVAVATLALMLGGTLLWQRMCSAGEQPDGNYKVRRVVDTFSIRPLSPTPLSIPQQQQQSTEDVQAQRRRLQQQRMAQGLMMRGGNGFV
jgi:hypothetical protein